MNYTINFDGALSSISLTDAEADGYEVFSTLAEAKAELLTFMRTQRDDFARAIRDVNRLTVAELQREALLDTEWTEARWDALRKEEGGER